MPEIKIGDQDYTINEGITVIGRGEDADIQIESGGLSRMHARLTIAGDTISIEDLGSKNGTFVNGQRLEASHELVKGDKLKVANLECQIQYAQTAPPAAPKAAPAKSKAAPGAAKRTGRQSNQTGLYVKAGVGVLILIIAFIAYSNYVPQDLKNARALLEDVGQAYPAFRPADTAAANADSIRQLEEMLKDLRTIPPDFRSERKKADEFTDEINSLIGDIRDRNEELNEAATLQAAIAACDTAHEQFTTGQRDVLDVLRELERIAAAHPGTDAETSARDKIINIRSTVMNREQVLLAKARAESQRLANDGQYTAALEAIDRCLAERFVLLAREELDKLAAEKEGIRLKARKVFQSLAAKAVAEAGTGDCEMIKMRLRQECDGFMMPELETDYNEALIKINAIKAARLAKARALLAKELQAVDKLLARRMYSPALSQYKKLLPGITEEELKAEIRIKQDHARLMGAAKKHIIDHINKQGGLQVENIGNIQKASEEAVDLRIDDVTMPLGWDKIRDSEFQLVLGMALAETPHAESYAAYGLMLMAKGKDATADEYFAKAIRTSPAIKDDYPDLLEATMARIAARAKEKAEVAAAKKKAAAVASASVAPMKPGKFKYTNNGIGGAGGIFAPGVSPVDPNFMVTCSDMSGCYRTDDKGKFWRMLHRKDISGAIHCKPFLHPKDVNIVIWKGRISRDKAWTFKPLVKSGGPWGGDRSVTHNACSSGADPHVFVGSGGGLWVGKAEGSFKQIATGASGGFAVLPDDLIYGAAGNNLYRWKAGMTEAEQVATPGVSGRIKAVAAGGSSKAHIIHLAASGGVFTSKDLGKTWTQTQSNGGIVDIVMAATQMQIAYSCDRPNVYVTKDAGKGWKSTFDMRSNVNRTWVQDEIKWGYYVVPNGLNCSWSDPNRVMMTTQAEFFLSEDGGGRWTGMVNERMGSAPSGHGGKYRSIGLEVTTTWDYVFAPDDPKKHFICYTDCGFAYSHDRGKTWSHPTGSPWGNTCYGIVFDPFVKGKVYGAWSSKHDIPGWTNVDTNYKPGGVCISTNYCQTWKQSTSGMPTNKPACGIDVHPDSKPGKTIVFATIYGDSVYRSDDSGETWTKKPGVGRSGNYHVYQVTCHKKTGEVFVNTTGNRRGMNFTPAGGLWKSGDKGETWTEVTENLKLGWPCNFAVHPENPNIIYIAAGTYPRNPQGGVHKTTDGGKTWKHCLTDQMTGGFNNCSFITMNPNDPNNLFFAGSRGLWVTSDGGNKWREVKEVPFGNCTRVRIDPLDPETMYVTSFGGGIFYGPRAK